MEQPDQKVLVQRRLGWIVGSENRTFTQEARVRALYETKLKVDLL